MKWFYILIISFLFSCSSQENKKLYEKKMIALQSMMASSRYSVQVTHYAEFNGKFPSNLNELYLHLKWIYDCDDEDMKYLEIDFLIDVFSKNNEWVGYFPIYNSDDSEIISYLILSAGIDGKLDNFNDSANKLHVDDWKQKLNLYNPDEFDGISIFSEEFDESWLYGYARRAYIEARPYNAKEEKYGNKDLLLYVHHYMLEMPEEDLQNWKNYLKSLEKE